jgi:hypothetical protein
MRTLRHFLRCLPPSPAAVARRGKCRPGQPWLRLVEVGHACRMPGASTECHSRSLVGLWLPARTFRVRDGAHPGAGG